MASMTIKWGSYFGKQSGGSSKSQLPYDPAVLLLVIYSVELEA